MESILSETPMNPHIDPVEETLMHPAAGGAKLSGIVIVVLIPVFVDAFGSIVNASTPVKNGPMLDDRPAITLPRSRRDGMEGRRGRAVCPAMFDGRDCVAEAGDGAARDPATMTMQASTHKAARK
jgi:hypothetical protein